METIAKENEATGVREEGKKKRKWGEIIVNFLAMGGIFIILLLGLGIALLINYLAK